MGNFTYLRPLYYRMVFQPDYDENYSHIRSINLSNNWSTVIYEEMAQHWTG